MFTNYYGLVILFLCFIQLYHADFINGTETDKPHPFIEDCIGRQDDLLKVLQLVCLQCQCNNGFKDKLLDYYRREIIQVITVINIYINNKCITLFMSPIM